MKPFSSFRHSHTGQSQRSRGFTLIEIMVALAIFMLMLTIILVPINMGARVTHIGTARADVQQSSQQLLNRIANELRQAVYVYPNDALPGVTDRPPFNNDTGNNPSGLPYYQQTGAGTDVCGATGRNAALRPAANTARIDFLLPRRSGNVLLTPVAPEYYVVTYYARRQDMSKPWNNDPNPYHAIDNPIVMYRAQYPYRENDGDTFLVAGNPNAQTNNLRYPSDGLLGNCVQNALNLAPINRGALWLTQNPASESNLDNPLLAANQRVAQQDRASAPQPNDNTSPASHQLVTPRDMGLVAPRASLSNTTDATKPMRSYQPSTTFIVDDANEDGKIDRVSIGLVLGQFDSGGSETRVQSVRLPMTVDLPNVR